MLKVDLIGLTAHVVEAIIALVKVVISFQCKIRTRRKRVLPMRQYMAISVESVWAPVEKFRRRAAGGGQVLFNLARREIPL